MTDWLTALMFGAGLGVWVFSYMMKNTMRRDTSTIAGATAGVAGFIVIITLIKLVFHF